MRFDQCTETCTTDCGHCKGRPVEALRADNERLSRRLAGRFEETETLRAEVASLRQQLAVCSCGSSPMTYEGPEPDCPVHGAVRAFNEASAEIAGLRQQLDEARGERDDLWRRFNSSQDSNKTLAAMAREELDLRNAAEADRDGLREHILDIDAHATPYGDIPDEPGWVGTYLVTAGSLHRALGKIGHSAPKCQAEEDLALTRQAFEEYRELWRRAEAALLADRDRLLDVYRAAEAWREWIIARAESIGPDEHALASKLDAYRAGAPAEAPDGERA